MKTYSIALTGQPNSGKSTLFNHLTGLSQIVGNLPGVTVEVKKGKFSFNNTDLEIIDLPGVYGLSPLTEDEKITRNFLLDNNVDLIINVIDGTNLFKGLFLTLQLLSLNIPMILVINMQDELIKQNIKINIERLKKLLGIKVILISCKTKYNIDYLKKEIIQFYNKDFVLRKTGILIRKNDKVYSMITSIKNILNNFSQIGNKSEFYALKFLEGNRDIDKRIKRIVDKDIYNSLKDIANRLGDKEKRVITIIEWLFSIARGIKEEVLYHENIYNESHSDKIDHILLNKFISIPLFSIVMLLIFSITFTLGDFIVSFLEKIFSISASFIENLLGNSFFSSLIIEGIIGGVGNVVFLLPYIFIMFFLIQMLEDSGYMARAAFVMDKLMHRLSLHGRSFIPLIMGYGCSVPAIMAVRILDNTKDRLKTIMMIPFIPCSARLTVIVLLGGALFGKQAIIIVFLLYLISTMVALFTGFIFSKFFIKSKSEGMIMELPAYRLPQFENMLKRSLLQSKEYLIKAGTIIFVISIIIFLLSYFPKNVNGGYIYITGKYITPFFKLLDFDTPMTVSIITGFFAKEAIISTLSIVYNVSDVSLRTFIATNWNIITGIVFMVFSMIYIPCIATIIIIKKETKSLKWTLISIIWSILIAYTLSYIVKIFLGVIF